MKMLNEALCQATSCILRASVREGKSGICSHVHLLFELVYVLNGSVRLTVNGREELARAGELAVIPPLCVHSLEGDGDSRFLTGVFSEELIVGFLTKDELYSTRSTSVYKPSRALVDYLTECGFAQVCTAYSGTREELLTVRVGLAAICREYLCVTDSSSGDTLSEALGNVLLYVAEHYREEISLASVGSAIGYTPWYISHCLEAIPDMNFCTLVNSLRVEYAKNLLVCTDLKNNEIALKSGFSSERSFFRAFLRIVGITPGEYRRTKQRNIPAPKAGGVTE